MRPDFPSCVRRLHGQVLLSFLGGLFLWITLVPGVEARVQGIYIPLPDREFQFDGKQVEVVEFLSFYCGHCFVLERYVPIIRGNFPGRIQWKIVPIFWGPASPKPGEAYLLARDMGKGEALKRAIFRANFIERQDIGKVEVLERLGAQVGLGLTFSKQLRSGARAQEAQEALDLARRLGVQETPTLLIAGKLLTSPSMVRGGMQGFAANVITIIRSILAGETP